MAGLHRKQGHSSFVLRDPSSILVACSPRSVVHTSIFLGVRIHGRWPGGFFHVSSTKHVQFTVYHDPHTWSPALGSWLYVFPMFPGQIMIRLRPHSDLTSCNGPGCVHISPIRTPVLGKGSLFVRMWLFTCCDLYSVHYTNVVATCKGSF